MTTLTSPLFASSDAGEVLDDLRQIEERRLHDLGADLERALRGDPDAVHRYVSGYRVLSASIAREAGTDETELLTALLTAGASDAPFLSWAAHYELGDAIGLGAVGRAREVLGLDPLTQIEAGLRLPIDAPLARRFVERVQRCLGLHEEPIARLMDALALSKTELAGLFGVTRQAVDRWMRDGVPAERQDKVAALLALVDLLERKLKAGRLPGIARRPAAAYDGQTMLDLIRQDRHAELLERTRASFDWRVSA